MVTYCYDIISHDLDFIILIVMNIVICTDEWEIHLSIVIKHVNRVVINNDIYSDGYSDIDRDIGSDIRLI